MSIKTEIGHIIKCSLNKLNIEKEVIVEIPKDKKNGDYSTNIALTLTKDLGKSPIDIANMIVENISDDKIERLEVVRPGFINIFVSKKYLLNRLNEIIDKGRNYGKSNIGNNKKLI